MKTIFKHSWIPLYLLPLFGGVLYASAFPIKGTSSFPLGMIFGMTLLLSTLSFTSKEEEESSVFKEIGSVLCFALGYNFFGYYWIPELLKVFGGINPPFNYIFSTVFTFIITPHLLAFVIGKRIYNKLKVKRTFLVEKLEARALLFAIILTTLEYVTPQQFPAHMGHPWLWFAPYIGLAKSFGAPLYSFIGFYLAISFAFFFRYKRVLKLPLITTLAVVIIGITMPLSKKLEGNVNSLNIRMTQGNIGNDLKIHSEKGIQLAVSQVIDIYKDLSVTKNSFSPDLIIWPETSYPRLLNSLYFRKNKDLIPYTFKDILHETSADLFVGGYDTSEKKNNFFFETQYNATFMFNNDKTLQDVYHKQVLIPFGESLPFGPLNETLAKYIQNVSFFAKGTTYPTFKSKKGSRFTAAICYEVLFSHFIRSYLNNTEAQPNFIVNLTNDSWYGDTSEPLQHLFLTHWRALEFNIPVVRSTNTGITSILYPDGSESKRLNYGEQSILDLVLDFSLDQKKTLFQVWGFFGMFLIWIPLYALALFRD